jgi:PPOX class probable FMN-dependent enzyme
MSDDGVLTIADEAMLRARYPERSQLSGLKELDHLETHSRNFIALSPFLVIGSTRPGQGTDVSPRGDHPGFVRVLDDHTLAIPDRPGNNRLDTLSNLLADAEVGLIFFVPGIDETLRVNGTASLSSDPALLAASAVNGKLPRMMVLVTVRQMFFHCGKALKRSRLWQDDYKVKRAAFPSLARVIIEQAKPAGVTVEEAEARVERSYKENLY